MHRADAEIGPEKPPCTCGEVFRGLPSAIFGTAYLHFERGRGHYFQGVGKPEIGHEHSLKLMIAVPALSKHAETEIQLDVRVYYHSLDRR